MSLFPPARIGIVGGGQLGMMVATEAKKLGYCVSVLDPTFLCPAGQIADRIIVSSFSDAEAFEELAKTCDVLTYEFEHIDAGLLAELEDKGHRVYPSAKCLASVNDKYEQKQMLKNAGIPVPLFLPVDGLEVSDCIDSLGAPLVFKHRRGGYDGKGNIVARTQDEIFTAWKSLIGKNAMVEQFIHYDRELSVIAAKDQIGNIAFYPLAENIHKKGILRMTRAPAMVDDAVKLKALEIAESVLSVLDSPGLFCIELFLDSEENIFVNEIAPRPHNTGHHTIDACRTSQYEQLIRIITGKPLGATDQVSPCVMVNILGNHLIEGEYSVEGTHRVNAIPNARLYWYGKTSTKHLRKLGHITVMDDSIDAAERKAKSALRKIELKPKT